MEVRGHGLQLLGLLEVLVFSWSDCDSQVLLNSLALQLLGTLSTVLSFYDADSLEIVLFNHGVYDSWVPMDS